MRHSRLVNLLRGDDYAVCLKGYRSNRSKAKEALQLLGRPEGMEEVGSIRSCHLQYIAFLNFLPRQVLTGSVLVVGRQKTAVRAATVHQKPLRSFAMC